MLELRESHPKIFHNNILIIFHSSYLRNSQCKKSFLSVPESRKVSHVKGTLPLPRDILSPEIGIQGEKPLLIKLSTSCDELMTEYAKMPPQLDNSLTNGRTLSVFFSLTVEAKREALA